MKGDLEVDAKIPVTVMEKELELHLDIAKALQDQQRMQTIITMKL